MNKWSNLTIMFLYKNYIIYIYILLLWQINLYNLHNFYHFENKYLIQSVLFFTRSMLLTNHFSMSMTITVGIYFMLTVRHA
jgi:hypothetical protein